MAQVGTHGRGQREVLCRGAWVTGADEGEAEPELRIIVTGTSVDDATEVAGRGRVLAGVELGPGERLEHALGPRLGGGGALEQLGGGRGTAAAEQVEAAPVELMSVGCACWDRILIRIWSIW